MDNPTSNLFSSIDFFVDIYKEKVQGRGEDSRLFQLKESSALMGVFDGCGGSGARKYDFFDANSLTGAYLASRVVRDTVRTWFTEEGSDIEQLRQKIKDDLSLCKTATGGAGMVRGSMTKDFPTTAAMIKLSQSQQGIQAQCIWAGDSRCYLLDEEGLKQLTEDDLGGIDPMENLRNDGVLTNVISASKDFQLHTQTINMDRPAFIFAASDGCFSYLSTPMDFEFVLLDLLCKAENPHQWEQNLAAVLSNIAADDVSLCGASLFFRSFGAMKEKMEKRRDFLLKRYIQPLRDKGLEEKTLAWQEYKKSYISYKTERGADL